MLKATHNSIEFEGNTIADFRPGIMDFTRHEVRDNIELDEHTVTQYYDGELIDKSEYDELETEKSRFEISCHETKRTLEDILNDLDNILETCGAKTAKKFDDIHSNIMTLIGDIKT